MLDDRRFRRETASHISGLQDTLVVCPGTGGVNLGASNGSVSGFTRTAVEKFERYFPPLGNVSSMKYAVQLFPAFSDFADIDAVLLLLKRGRLYAGPIDINRNRAFRDWLPATALHPTLRTVS